MLRPFAAHLVLAGAIAWLAACGGPAPTTVPTLTSAQATRTAIRDAPSEGFITATPLPTSTLTPTPTEAPTLTSTPTLMPTRIPPVVVPGGTPPPGAPWTMAPLLSIFTALGSYPPESPLPRQANINPLTGLPVGDPAVLQRRPILARLMNDPSARPQTGLNEADLVFEELIDQKNGIFALTRLTAVYLANDSTIRPFRSARLINASLTPMFDGALTHSGGSNGTRFLLSKMPLVNLDQFFAEPVYCGIDRLVDGKQTLTWVSSTVARVHDYMKSKNQEKAVLLRGFAFQEASVPGTAIASIIFDRAPWPVSTSLAGKVEWRYAPDKGRYLRFVNGAPHNTLQYPIAGKWGGDCQVAGAVNSVQVSAANIVVLYAPHLPTDIVEDSNNFTNVYIDLVGEGKAQVLRDGVLIEGKWRRPTLQHFFEFVDQNGAVIPLKPGNTWFQIVPTGFQPTYK